MAMFYPGRGPAPSRYYMTAYDVARKNGFEGTAEEWIASLQGKSAYEIAVANGFSGTEQEWNTAVNAAKNAAAASASAAAASAAAAAASATSAGNIVADILPHSFVPVMEIGNIMTDGTLSAANNRIRTEAIAIDGDYKVSFSGDGLADYRYYIYFYNPDGSFNQATSITMMTNPTTIAFANYKGTFRIVFRKVNSADEMTADDITFLKGVTTVSCSNSLRDRFVMSITPELFGAKGDGITDDTTPIKTALKYGGRVELTAGKKYRITSMLEIIRNGTILEGNGAEIISDVASGPMLLAYGKSTDEYNLTVNVFAKDGSNSLISIGHASGPVFNVGDTALIQSQRDAFSAASGLYWCGTPTSNSSSAYWAEVLTVNNKVNTQRIECSGTLTYPYYFANAVEGVDYPEGERLEDQSRQHSTIRKVDFLTDVHIRNVTFVANGGSAHIDNTILFALCRDSSAYNVTVRKNKTDAHGRAFAFQNCLNCRFENCVADANKVYDADQMTAVVVDNHFTFASSWHCTASGCSSYHAGQTFDVTYAALYNSASVKHIKCPCVDVSMIGCVVHGSASSASTEHSGSYCVTVSGCSFTNCSKPVLLRSPHSIFTNNRIIGRPDSAHYAKDYGLYLYEPTIFQSIVANNTIIGTRGIRVYPYNSRSSEPNEELSALGITISGNEIMDSRGGVYIQRGADWETDSDMCITVRDNVFRGVYGAPVLKLEDEKCNGVEFTGNTMISCSSNDDEPYLVVVNGADAVVENNKVVGCDVPIEPEDTPDTPPSD